MPSNATQANATQARATQARATQTRDYNERCGIATALDVIGDRWAILVLRDLLLGPLRFGQLADGLPGIGTNTLSERLKDLEASGVVARRLLPLPDRGTVYELTDYGHEIQPALIALGRWGTKSMGRLPADAASRSRWLAPAMLAFRKQGVRIERPASCEFRLDNGSFVVRADGADLSITDSSSGDADLMVTTTDEHVLRMLSGRLSAADAIATGLATVVGDKAELAALLELFAFPDFD